MRIHLVTYATPRFRHRQLILGWSARLYRVVDTVTHWTPKKLLAAGFEERCKGIQLSERGSGFWAWKPLIIDAKLREVPAGDLVFYCDVGRRFPYKILDRPLDPFLRWMDENTQDFLPGLKISWRGPLAFWTKRDAFVCTGMNTPDIHAAASVQASFSLWRAKAASRDFVARWLDLCSVRQLISDDPSACGVPELPEFHEHRHDQSLLTLCCLKYGARALDMGNQTVPIDTRNLSQVLAFVFNLEPCANSFSGSCLKTFAWLLEVSEKWLRKYVKFGQDQPDHPLARD
jgi:hypothetical protein